MRAPSTNQVQGKTENTPAAAGRETLRIGVCCLKVPQPGTGETAGTFRALAGRASQMRKQSWEGSPG